MLFQAFDWVGEREGRWAVANGMWVARLCVIKPTQEAELCPCVMYAAPRVREGYVEKEVKLVRGLQWN